MCKEADVEADQGKREARSACGVAGRYRRRYQGGKWPRRGRTRDVMEEEET